MEKVLDIAAYHDLSVAVGYDRIIYVWGEFFQEFHIPIPFSTKFSNICDAFAYSKRRCNSLIVFPNNFKYVEKVLNILESLRTVFDDPV